MQENVIAIQKHIWVFEMIFLCKLLTFSLKGDVSVGNSFEIHELEKNELFKLYLNQMEVQEMWDDYLLRLWNYVSVH
jgi:hypothetical protein